MKESIGTHIPPEALERFRETLDAGAARAGSNLSLMTHNEVEFEITRLEEVPVENLRTEGIPEHVPCAMIALRFSGDADGFAVFLMYEQSAKKINELLWGEVPSGEGFVNVSSVSALKEMGNIVGSAFLNCISDRLQISLLPSEPLFLYDMLGALMDAIIIEESMMSDSVLDVETIMQIAAEGIEMRFLFLPSPSLFDRLKEN